MRARTTISDWYDLVRWLRPGEPVALSAAEADYLDEQCRQRGGHMPTRPWPSDPIMLFMGHPLVEVDYWPELPDDIWHGIESYEPRHMETE